jgi:hypothetical protein
MHVEELIVIKLDTFEKKIEALDEKVTLCRIEIAGLKVKSGIWGAVAGMIPVAIGLGMWIMSVP